MVRSIVFSVLLAACVLGTGCGMGATWVDVEQVNATRGTDDRVTLAVTLKCISNGDASFCERTHYCVSAKFFGASSSSDGGVAGDAASDASEDAASDADASATTTDGWASQLDTVELCHDRRLAIGDTDPITLVSNIPLPASVLTSIQVQGPEGVGDTQTLAPP